MIRVDLGKTIARAIHTATTLAILGGCVSVDPYSAAPMSQHMQRDDEVGYCARLFADIDRRVDSVGVRDAEARRVSGFPYLRVDRFTSTLGQRAIEPAQQRAWLMRLQQLDEAGRATELANAALTDDDLPRCRTLLAATDAAAISDLRSTVKVPDSYTTSLRVLGVYPLTRVPFASGIARWQADTRSAFSAPLSVLSVHGKLQRYVLAPGTFRPISPPSLDALGVPVFSAAQAAALFARHAPGLEIDVAGPFDRIGKLALDEEDGVIVDTHAPVVYTRLTYTVIAGLIHPQLVYTFWFSERPAANSNTLDLLAGKLDGVVWRVTLDSAGEALVYDSIHACGCYHLFFPTERVVARDLPATLDETLFVPQTLPIGRPGDRVMLRIESATHYLQRVMQMTDARSSDVAYKLMDERSLTMLPRRDGSTRSAYGPDGFIAGTERAERWFFWPMGIESAGQMRQWGHHATAFVGRRHFDDPLLFDAYFEIRR